MKYIAFTISIFFMFTSCNEMSQKQTFNQDINSGQIDKMSLQNKTFEEIFTQVESNAVRKTLSGYVTEEDYTVITAGTESKFNSMAASWEFLGHYFEKPMTFCLLGAERYTLEFIKEHQTYTMTLLPKQFRSDLYAFGSKSGRNSDKMKETNLSYVKTPSGNITYKEAKVVIECKLFEMTTVNSADFYDSDAKNFAENGRRTGGDYHKLVFGMVTNVWVRK